MSEAAQAARLLTRSEVFSLLSWPELIEATQQALVTMATDQTAAAGTLQLRVPGASMHLKAGALMDPAVVAVKANMRPDAGSSAGVIVAFDPLRFTVRAVMDSADLTRDADRGDRGRGGAPPGRPGGPPPGGNRGGAGGLPFVERVAAGP
jgi:hypothetical protein